jgi:hypothetical protein
MISAHVHIRPSPIGIPITRKWHNEPTSRESEAASDWWPHSFPCRLLAPSVWAGRALQAESDDLEVVGHALLYPALEWNVCVPGHHRYTRARSHSRSRPRRPYAPPEAVYRGGLSTNSQGTLVAVGPCSGHQPGGREWPREHPLIQINENDPGRWVMTCGRVENDTSFRARRKRVRAVWQEWYDSHRWVSPTRP